MEGRAGKIGKRLQAAWNAALFVAAQDRQV